MNRLTDIEYIKNLFRQFGLKPRHYLGQNFLVDSDALAQIVAAADLSKEDSVIEVGPGIGVLTHELALNAGELYTIEKDRNLIPILKRQIKDFKNVKVINDDILRVNLEEIVSKPYKVVANIPYYLTSHLIQHFLTQKIKPKLLVLMVQKEVGERIVAKAGELSILGISVQIFADPEIVASVSKNSFWPKPEVDSVILRIKPTDKFPEIEDHKLFFRPASEQRADF
jgi:16S rRNA (adenine1518-N6/adenine1519-N6)-dimethyltransferase